MTTDYELENSTEENLDTTETETGTQQPSTPEDALTPTEEDADQPEEAGDKADKAIGKAKREAAKYRRQLRETEATVETLTGELTETRRQVAEQMVAGLTDRFAPNALWQIGVEISDLLDDAGRVDPAKVSESVSEVRDKLGLKDRQPPTLRPTEKLRGGLDPTNQHSPQQAFTAAFGPRT